MKPKKRLLIVDDSLPIRTLVQRIFDEGGYEVLTAEDGVQGLDMARAHIASIFSWGLPLSSLG
ncbi:MAG: hypothetical protein ABII00_00380 [Elusimicrobiota bacterium]